VESEKTLEIIVLNEDKFICYRRGNIETFNKAIEEQSTIRYIAQVYKINPNDIAIYHITNETISGFTEKSTRYMHLVSQNLNCKLLGFSRVIRGIVSCICSLVSCYLAFVTAVNSLDLFAIKNKKQSAEMTQRSIDSRIFNEIDFWSQLPVSCYRSQPRDLKEIVGQKVAEAGLKRVNKITLSVNDHSGTVLVNLDESGRPLYDDR
jgi:hypothetical protein